MNRKMVWDWRIPNQHEVYRALDYTGWAYEGGGETAEQMYREQYGDLPCFAMEEPDGGLLMALQALYKVIRGIE